MSFYPRRRRTAPAIIIISLIDVLIVLLVFLLVTTTYRNQPNVKIALPEIGGEPKEGAGAAIPLLELGVKAGDDVRYLLAGLPVTSEALGDRLRQLRRERPNSRVVIRADRAAEWERVLKAMREVRTAGFTNVQALTTGAAGSR
jgi:biopolymer transport protein ExbD